MPTSVQQSYEKSVQPPQRSLAEMEAATGTTPPHGRHTTTLLQVMQANRPTWFFISIFSLIVLCAASFIRSYTLTALLATLYINSNTDPIDIHLTYPLFISPPWLYAPLSMLFYYCLLGSPIGQMIEYARLQQAHLHVDASVAGASIIVCFFDLLLWYLGASFQLPMWVQFVYRMVMALAMFQAAVMSHRAMRRVKSEVESTGAQFKSTNMNQVNNIVAFVATYLIIDALLSVFTVVAYSGYFNVSLEAISNIGLLCISAMMWSYFLFDLYKTNEYTHHTYTPYIQLLIFMTNVLIKQWHHHNSCSFSILIVALFTMVMLSAKIVTSNRKAN